MPVSVAMTVTGMTTEQEAVVVHVDDAGEVNVQSSEVQDPLSGSMEVTFDAGAFSMYAVVVTETISTHYIDASGNTWNVEVSYGPEAGIPSGATLSVSELEGAEADDYAARAAEALKLDTDSVNYAKTLDIAITAEGRRVQPDIPVSVSIRLLDMPGQVEEQNINVVHFGSRPESVSYAFDADTVIFEADGFSVYVVINVDGQTVVPQASYVFHYESKPVVVTFREATVSASTVMDTDFTFIPSCTSTPSCSTCGRTT